MHLNYIFLYTGMNKVLSGMRMSDFSFTIRHTELEEGIKLSIENAERLIRDAEILCESYRCPSASYLAIVALEEEGKALMLLRNLLNNKDITFKQWKKGKFTNHIKKINAVEEMISRRTRKLRMKIGEERWKQVQPALLARYLRRNKDDYLYVDWDFETRKTQITDKWKSPSKNVVFDIFHLVDEKKRCETAEGLIFEAKLGLEATLLFVEEKLTEHKSIETVKDEY